MQQDQDMQEKRTQQEAAKQAYEKPQLGRVSLFADQVLQDCASNNPCEDPMPRF